MAELVAEKPSRSAFDDLRLLLRPGQRIETLDGTIMMSPSPGFRHEVVAQRLRRAFDRVLPEHLIAIGPISVDLGETVPEPDVVVVDEAGEDRVRLSPEDVRLAVEIVSPSSRTNDRVTKPAVYATAGIACYWRVETTPRVSITVHVLRRGDDVYAEVGTWSEGESLHVTEPFDVVIAIDDLVPRGPRPHLDA